jgi:hypothetical protein
MWGDMVDLEEVDGEDVNIVEFYNVDILWSRDGART